MGREAVRKEFQFFFEEALPLLFAHLRKDLLPQVTLSSLGKQEELEPLLEHLRESEEGECGPLLPCTVNSSSLPYPSLPQHEEDVQEPNITTEQQQQQEQQEQEEETHRRTLSSHYPPVMGSAGEHVVPAAEGPQSDVVPNKETSGAPLPAPVLQRVMESSGKILQYIEGGSRETGRRYLDVFPAELVALLCVAVVPSAWQWENRVRGRGASPSTPSVPLAASPLSYREWGQLLSHRLVQVHDALSPRTTVSALRALQNGDLLSDDVLSPVAKTLLDPVYLQRHFDPTPQAGELSTVTLSSSSVVRPLMQYGYVSISPFSAGSAEAAESTLASQKVRQTDSAETGLATAALRSMTTPSKESVIPEGVMDGETACRWACVLGRQSAPGHFHLHKIFHTLLLPPLTKLLQQEVEETDLGGPLQIRSPPLDHRTSPSEYSSAADPQQPRSSLAPPPLPPSSCKHISPSLQSWTVLHDLLSAFVRYAVSEADAVHALLSLCLKRLPHLSLPQLVELLHTLSPSSQAAFVEAYRQRRASASPADGMWKNGSGTSSSKPHPMEELAAGCYDPLLGGVCQTMAQLFAMVMQIEERVTEVDHTTTTTNTSSSTTTRGKPAASPPPLPDITPSTAFATKEPAPPSIDALSSIHQQQQQQQHVVEVDVDLSLTNRSTGGEVERCLPSMPPSSTDPRALSHWWGDVWTLERATATALMASPTASVSPGPAISRTVSNALLPPWISLFDSMMALLRVQPYTAYDARIRLAWETAYTTNATLLLHSLLRMAQMPTDASPDNLMLFTRKGHRGEKNCHANRRKMRGKSEKNNVGDKPFTPQDAHHLLEALLSSSSSRTNSAGRRASGRDRVGDGPPPFHPLFVLLLRELVSLVPVSGVTARSSSPREENGARDAPDSHEGIARRPPESEDHEETAKKTEIALLLRDANMASTVLRACVRLEEWWGVSFLHPDGTSGMSTQGSHHQCSSREAILKLFRHHGSRLRPAAFVAGLSLLSSDYLYLSPPSSDATPLTAAASVSSHRSKGKTTSEERHDTTEEHQRPPTLPNSSEREEKPPISTVKGIMPHTSAAAALIRPAPSTSSVSPVPLWSVLPPSSQARVTAHVTRIAVSLPPKTLVKAMVALMEPQLRAMEILQATAVETVRADQSHGTLTSSSPSSSSSSTMALSLVDPVSLHQWLSRFTAVDVVRQLGLRQCADLLYYLGRLSSFHVTEEQIRTSSSFASLAAAFSSLRRDNALAVDALVRRSGAALLQTLRQDHEAETDDLVEDALTPSSPLSAAQRQRRKLLAALQSVPQLVSGLRAADVLYPYILSRLCRLVYLGAAAVDRTRPGPRRLLKKGEEEEEEALLRGSSLLSSSRPLISLGEILPGFKAVAEEWRLRNGATSMRHSGSPSADGTLFRDAWETLRERVVEMNWESEEEEKDVWMANNGGDTHVVVLNSTRTVGQGGRTPTENDQGAGGPSLSHPHPQQVLLPAAPYRSLRVVLEAWNAFALLDPTDRPVFLVLLHRLWTLMQSLTPLTPPLGVPPTPALAVQPPPDGKEEEEEEKEEGASFSLEAPRMAHQEPYASPAAEIPLDETARSTMPESRMTVTGTVSEASLSHALPRSVLAALVLSSLEPAALSTLVLTLLYKSSDPAEYENGNSVVDELLPLALLTLSQDKQLLLHPMDLTLLLISFLGAFVQVSVPPPHSSQQSGWLSVQVNLHVLHKAYDTCRSVFLHLYTESATEEAPLSSSVANTDSLESTVGRGDHNETEPRDIPVKSSDTQKNAATASDGTDDNDNETRTLVTHAMASEVSEAKVVPRQHFASLLIALANAGLEDPALASACAAQLFSPRRGRQAGRLPAPGSAGGTTTLPFLTSHELVNLFLALCFHFPPPSSAAVTESRDMGARKEAKGSADVGSDEERRSDTEAEGEPCPHDPSNTSKPSSAYHKGMAAPTPRQRFLRPVLDALWHRTEELDIASLHALRRCLLSGAGRLRYDGGDGDDPHRSPASSSTTEKVKVDEDFLLRLEEQETFLREKAVKAARLREEIQQQQHQQQDDSKKEARGVEMNTNTPVKSPEVDTTTRTGTAREFNRVKGSLPSTEPESCFSQQTSGTGGAFTDSPDTMPSDPSAYLFLDAAEAAEGWLNEKKDAVAVTVEEEEEEQIESLMGKAMSANNGTDSPHVTTDCRLANSKTPPWKEKGSEDGVDLVGGDTEINELNHEGELLFDLLYNEENTDH